MTGGFGRYLCVVASYTLMFCLTAHPSLGALTTACFCAAIFCGALWLTEKLFSAGLLASFIIANAALILLADALLLQSSQSVQFTSVVAGETHWADGVPTWRGIAGMIVMSTLCVLTNALGIGLHQLLKRRLALRAARP